MTLTCSLLNEQVSVNEQGGYVNFHFKDCHRHSHN